MKKNGGFFLRYLIVEKLVTQRLKSFLKLNFISPRNHYIFFFLLSVVIIIENEWLVVVNFAWTIYYQLSSFYECT